MNACTQDQPTTKMRWKRRAIAIAVGAVVLTGAVLAVAVRDPVAAGEQVRAATASVTVRVVAPVSTTFERAIGASGTIKARDELIIGSDASGVRLLEVRVEAGSVVRKGDLLARGDDAQLRAQLAQQQAALKQAQADSRQADANLDRAERLRDSGVYSVETIQQRRTSAASAAAKVELAAAQVRELEVKIAQTRIVAPAAGVISRKSTTVGAVVQPGTELFRLIRDGELEWLGELPGHALTKITSGTPARVLLDDGRAIEAKVRLVEPTLDASTRNGLVHVVLPRGAPLKAGEHARGEILIAQAETMALPESSVLVRDGYSFVYVLGADDVARLVKIRTGARRNGLVEVSDGINVQARVIGTGAGFVKDGDLVRVAPDERLAQTGDKS